MGEDLRRTLVGAHHADHTAERRIIQLLAPLEKPDEFLEQPCDASRVTSAEEHLVAPDCYRGGGELSLDLAQMLITRSGEGREQMLTGDDDPDRGVSGCHAEPIMRGHGRLQRRRRRRRCVDSSPGG